MSILLALPILSLVIILQTAVFSRMILLQGTADIMLLTIIAWALQKEVKTGWQWAIIGGLLADFSSGLPFGIYTVGYLLTIAFTMALRARIWQFEILVQLFSAFLGTLLTHAFSLLAVLAQGANLSFQSVIERITLPSLVLNLILGIPIYILIQELALQVYPEEIEI